MRRHTLKEFMEHYNPGKIQLVFGQHLINIDTYAEGSAVIIRCFKDRKFELVSVTEYDSFVKEKFMILKY